MKKLKECRFVVGERVQVISECLSTGTWGSVIEIIERGYDLKQRIIRVRLDSGENRKYSELSLISKKEVEMMAIAGNYNVAKVQFIDGYNTKEYCFALFDNDIVKGDCVLCDTINGYLVGKVESIIPQSDCRINVTKEVICKVDFSAFERRKEIRKKTVEIKTKLDNAVKRNKDLALYETIAKSDEEVAALLQQYKDLLNG